MDLALRFYQIFAGLDRAHGSYEIPADAVPDDKGKIKGRAITRQLPVTVELWQRHLDGDYGLGIVPIRDDNTCVFGAIDVDVYPLDTGRLRDTVVAMKLPLLVCRTKSGGAHLYLFTRKPVPAALLRAKLTEMRDALGYGPRRAGGKSVPGSEIFPKQDEILSREDTGNWINVPYFDGERSMRYCFGKTRALSPVEFLDAVEYYAIADADALAAIAPAVVAVTAAGSNEHPKLPGAPPCLAILANTEFPAGTRNNALFSLVVYAKKAFPEGEWQDRARKLAAEFTPSQSQKEITDLIRGVEKKSYGYKCKDQPICDVCDRPTCVTREHGVGGGASVKDLTMTFGVMTKVLTKPVTWLWEIDGELIDFETEALMNQKLFQARLVEALNLWPPSIKPVQWRDLIQETIGSAQLLAVPDDATADGQLWDYLSKFCTARVAGKNLDELLMGRPFTDPPDIENPRSYFVASDLVAYLIQHRFPNKINERLIYLSLRDRGLLHHRTPLKGKTLTYWSVPAFQAQTQEHDVPRETPKEAM